MIDNAHNVARTGMPAESSTTTHSIAPSASATRRCDDALLADDSREVLDLISRVRRCDPGLFSHEPDSSADDPADTSATIGRFEIIRELGRGGFGVVLLARDPNLDRLVALKVPHPDVVLSPELSERFLREGKAAAALGHPNIVPVYEAAAVGPISYLVSAYCDGPSLASWLQEQTGQVDPRLAARLVRDMALAVQHAHERGIIHRDLKPGNVLLESEAGDRVENAGSDRLKPLITDFGMARVTEDVSDSTLTGAALGTPAYMSPEQAAGRRNAIGPSTDVYALGVILYEMLTGHRPFAGETTLAVLHAIQNESPTPPAQCVASIPTALDAICLKCLSRDPSERFASAGALATTLDRFLAAGPVEIDSIPNSNTGSRSTSRPVPFGRFPRSAVALLCVIGIFAFAFLPHWRGGGSRQDVPGNTPLVQAAALPILSGSAGESDDVNRRVTNWVLSHGGHTFGGGRWIKRSEHIPAEPFTVIHVCVQYIDSIDESRFQDLLRLRECVTWYFALTGLDDSQLQRLARPGITTLHLDQTAVTDEGMRHVVDFPDLRSLDVAGRQFTDELLRSAPDWPELTSLKLISTQVTNDGLRGVADMSSLTSLSLSGNQRVDDDGLRPLSRLSRLETLDLRGTRVTDGGVFEFRSRHSGCGVIWDSPDPEIQSAFHVLNAHGRLRLATDGPSIAAESPADFPAEPFTVREIDLRGSTHITDDVLESIRQLRELETLHLPAIDHTQTGLSFLREVASLRRLVLHDVAPDPATIAALCRIGRLEVLEFHDGKLTDEQRADLESSLPECRVIVMRASS